MRDMCDVFLFGFFATYDMRTRDRNQRERERDEGERKRETERGGVGDLGMREGNERGRLI